MSEALVALGSNVGCRLSNLQRAVGELARIVDVALVSGVYETSPMYVVDQPPFLNAAICVRTPMGPLSLLKLLKDVERRVGRAPRQRYGPREIDLDLIAYGALRYAFHDTAGLVLSVPHPKLRERRFVLKPLADLGPERVIPGWGDVASLLAETESQAPDVQPVNDAVLSLSGSR
jgi:2-amino-4-hydroxy-6-hydroxymethyldihydropteridine diphosphokinase